MTSSSMWDELKGPVMDKWHHRWLAAHPMEVGTYSWDYLFKGGKELRPQFFCALWTFLAPHQPASGELALAIEGLHVVSLVLDDLPWMDNAATRRGRPTLHQTLSIPQTLLVCGDVLAMVGQLWAEARPHHISPSRWALLLTKHMHALTLGQWYDLTVQGSAYDLAALKTGALFALITETVAYCVLDVTEGCTWGTWGREVGILFQWNDDWVDRDEDAAMGQRNPFLNEKYATLWEANILWQRVTLSGPCDRTWWSTNFGVSLARYLHPPIIVDIVAVPLDIAPNVILASPAAQAVFGHPTLPWYSVASGVELLAKLAWVLEWILTGLTMDDKAIVTLDILAVLESLSHDLWLDTDTAGWESTQGWQAAQQLVFNVLFHKV